MRILLDVMHVPYLFDTTCVESLFKLWAADTNDASKARWNRSEWHRQRKLLRQVCKSWKHFAETEAKAYRSVGPKDFFKDPHILAHARRALVCKYLKHMITMPTVWEVVEIYKPYFVDEFLASVAQGNHPQLRRLCLRITTSNLSALCGFSALCQLTFLHIHFCPMPTHATAVVPLTLPRLEVLIWEDSAISCDPSSIFRLPNLHHLGWSSNHSPSSSTLLSCARTLRSLSIRIENEDKLVLPDLNEFPHLEELSINLPFEIVNPKPLPPTYPLHTIYLFYTKSLTLLVPCIMQILSCNPVKLRRIQFPVLKRGQGGELENATDYEVAVQIVQLEDMFRQRGIRVLVSKGEVRSEMPITVKLSDPAIRCVWTHSMSLILTKRQEY